MVNYGTQLLKARRPGWEMAYLNYNELKSLLDGMSDIISKFCSKSEKDLVCTEETSLIRRGSSGEDNSSSRSFVPEKYEDLLQHQAEKFLKLLRQEVEKVSLYAISRQGELADAIGSLRFNININYEGDVEMGKTLTLHNSEIDFLQFVSEEDSPEQNISSAAEETLVDDLSALLPNFTSTIRKPSSILQGDYSRLKKNSRLMFEGSGVFKSSVNSDSINASFSDNWVPLTETNDNLNESQTATDDQIDDYTIIAVEVLHLLRYICINAMAIRKIIKKYEKSLQKCTAHGLELDLQDVRDWDDPEYEIKPQFTPQLVGDQLKRCHDKHFEQIHHLATSASMEALTASILLGATESESSNRDVFEDPEASKRANESLLRVKCAIYCIEILREYAEVVNQSFTAFLSRQAMIITGQQLGDLGGMKVRALQVILKFDPDTILCMDNSQLVEWQEKCWNFAFGTVKRLRKYSVVEDEGLDAEIAYLVWGGSDKISMRINFVSIFLYTVNYYIVSPTANRYAILLGSEGAFGSTLIGGASLAAFFGSFMYSWWYTRFSFKSALITSSFLSVVGNILYALAISFHSIGIAFIGRMLVGLGSAEVINRQIISSCVHYNSMTKASVALVVASALGMSVGPLLAAVLDEICGRDVRVDLIFPTWIPGIDGVGVIVNNVTSPAFLMSSLWLIELLATIFFFSEPIRINSFKRRKGEDEKSKGWISELISIKDLVFKNAALPITLLIYCYIEMVDEILLSSCAMVCKRYFLWNGSVAGFILAALGSLVLPADYLVERASRFYEERKILKYSLFYICIGFFIMINYQGLFKDLEIIHNDVDTIVTNITEVSVNQWIESTNLTSPIQGPWDEDENGFSNEIGDLTGGLDSNLIKDSVKENTRLSDFPAGDWHHILGVPVTDIDPKGITRARDVTEKSSADDDTPQEIFSTVALEYDWGRGTLIYLFSLSFVFMGTVVLEGVDTSLLSISAPAKLNSTFLSVGLLTTLMGTAGRVIGDFLITLSAVIDYLPFTDFVNSTFIPMIPITMIGIYLVQRHYNTLVYS